MSPSATLDVCTPVPWNPFCHLVQHSLCLLGQASNVLSDYAQEPMNQRHLVSQNANKRLEKCEWAGMRHTAEYRSCQPGEAYLQVQRGRPRQVLALGGRPSGDVVVNEDGVADQVRRIRGRRSVVVWPVHYKMMCNNSSALYDIIFIYTNSTSHMDPIPDESLSRCHENERRRKIALCVVVPCHLGPEYGKKKHGGLRV